MLLGLDFLHKFSIKVDWGRGWMYACEEEIPLYVEHTQDSRVSWTNWKTTGEKESCVKREMTELRKDLQRLEVKCNEMFVQNSSLLVVMESLKEAVTTNHQTLTRKERDHEHFNAVAGSAPSRREVKQQSYVEVKENVPVDETGGSVSFRNRETKYSEKKKSQRKQEENIVSDTVRDVRESENSNTDLPDYAKACGNVMFTKDVFVPARSQVVCMANFQGKSQVKAEHLVIEPSDDIPQGLFLSRSLCKRNDAIPIRIMNITTEPLILQRKRLLMHMRPK